MKCIALQIQKVITSSSNSMNLCKKSRITKAIILYTKKMPVAMVEFQVNPR